MDPIIIILFVLLAVFLLLSVPIGIAIGLSVLFAILFDDKLTPQFLVQRMFSSLDLFPLMAVPFFILAGSIMMRGSMARRLLDLSRSLVGHVTGGMAQISVLTSMFYGALSGSSPATVAAVGGVMIPSMEKEGYSKPFATAVNTAAGCLGVMIPPSIPLIIYGAATGTSVGDLFIAGIIPGLLVGVALMIVSYLISRKRGYRGTGKRSTFKEFLVALNNAKYSLLVPIIVLGGIYGGITTPTEAAVIAVVYSLIIEAFVHRDLGWSQLFDSLRQTTVTSASIFLVVATATVLAQTLTFYNVPNQIVTMLTGITESTILMLLIINVFLLIMGTFMDALANILILGPLLLPVVQAYGVDPVHFGILMIVNLSLGFLTPPVGVNLYVGCGISNISIERLSVAIIPFLLACIVTLLMITYLPQISLWLPGLK
ncbi:TRAP transporter large permease [Anaerobacillus sp. MEB173]|uniref:TRAP transporter large permease n=1 Tax=Anaerobacillus sp. MEB173 TaxID=3383345 RepID=UPI003F91F2D2